MVEEKQNLTIACTGTGQPKPKITWSKSVNKLPKDRNKVVNGALTIYHAVKKDGGTYICKADNILSSATDTAQLIVFSPLRFKVKPPKEVTPATGYTVHLPCMAESDLRVLKNNTLVLNSTKKSHKGSYTCRATNALKTIETEVKINSPVRATSCSVIKKNVSSVSGNYVIDPDGEGGLAPFPVYCDMTTKHGIGVTVISHDSESRTSVKGYESPGTYLRDVRYPKVSLSQLASLTRVSSHCEQFIKYECYGSHLFNNVNNHKYGWWVSRYSTKMTYWGGGSI